MNAHVPNMTHLPLKEQSRRCIHALDEWTKVIEAQIERLRSPTLFGVVASADQDVATDMICRELDLPKRAFAAPLKSLLASLFDVPHEELDAWKRSHVRHPRLKVTVREALQILGDGFRSIQEDVWVNQAPIHPHTRAVFSDVVHVNEASRITANGGVVILIAHHTGAADPPSPFLAAIDHLLQHTRGSPVRVVYRPGMPEMTQHVTWFLRNDGSRSDLQRDMRRILRHYSSSSSA